MSSPSPFAVRQHPLAELVSLLRETKRVPDAWRARHEASMADLWTECAEPGVLLDVLFLDADRDTWVAAMRAVLEEARSTSVADAVEALRGGCDVVRAIAPAAPPLDRLVHRACLRSAREWDAMGYPL